MKRAISLLLVVIMLSATVTSLVGCNLVYELFFRHPERAAVLIIPEVSEIKNINLTAKNGGTHTLPQKDYDFILSQLGSAQAYDESYTDFVYGYYTYEIRINLGGDARHYYLYEERGRLLLEVPYSGVYMVDRELYDYVAEYFE